MLCGRSAEQQRIETFLEAVRASRSDVLVVRGAPGVGKSALLEYARASSRGMRVLVARGVESEVNLPFAALHQLLRPALSEIDRLPAAQAAALAGALGLAERTGDERFLVSVACLTLLSEFANEGPVLCLIDDAHWLDTASADALLFVARRLGTEGVGMLLAAREGDARRFDTDLPALEVRGLETGDAETLLEHGARVQIAAHVRDYLLEQSQGNPLALIELSSALSDEQLTGSVPIEELPITGGIERVFLDRVRRLSTDTQALLLIAATDDSGQVVTILRAAGWEDGDDELLAEAETAGLVSVRGARVEFRHPLVRSAVYAGAGASRRRAAHRALAEALPDGDSDRKAWHRAASAVEPDEDIVADLDAAAERAKHRGAHAAAALAFERAAQLTAGGERRGERLIAAADASVLAGQMDRAMAHLDRAEALVSDPRRMAEIRLLRGSTQLWIGSASRAAGMLTESARAVAPYDTGKALELLMMAVETATMAGAHQQLVEAASSAESLIPGSDATHQFIATYLHGVEAFLAGDRAGAAPSLKSCLDTAQGFSDAREILWGAGAAFYLGERDLRQAFLDRAVARARSTGAVGLLPYPLAWRSGSEFQLGRVAEAAADAAEAATLARDIGFLGGAAYPTAILARVAALEGRDHDARTLAQEALELAAVHGLAVAAAHAELALAELDLARTRWADALHRLEALAEVRPGQGHPVFAMGTAPDLIEAAVRSGHHERAREALIPFRDWVEETDASWERARLERCCGLLSAGPEAGRHFDEALRLDGDAPAPLDRARTQLLYGEHLRRERRRVESRPQLRAALDAFERVGAVHWADRARGELRASGETARKRDPTLASNLTPQELQTARLVAEGLSNKEVAASLFLSPRTIDAHLRSVFVKLGISSRGELASLGLATPSAGDPAVPA